MARNAPAVGRRYPSTPLDPLMFTFSPRSVAFVVLLSLISLSSCAIKIENLPSPQSSPAKCGRPKASSICDTDQLLSPSAALTAEGLLNFIAAPSHGNPSVTCGVKQTGYQMAIALMLHLPSSTSAEKYAKSLHDVWGVGDAACDNGILLLIAIEDRQLYISTGAGAKLVLPDASAASVLESMKPALRRGSVDDAVLGGVAAISRVLRGETADGGNFPVAPEEPWSLSATFDALFMAMFGVLFCAGVIGSNRPGPRQRWRRCQTALARLEADRDDARQGVFPGQASCPICLEDFERVSPPPSVDGGDATGDGEAASSGGLGHAAAAGLRLRRELPGASDGGVADGGGTSSDAPTRTGAEAVSVGGEESEASESQSLLTQELPESEQALRCGHKFHRTCLREMLTNTSSSDNCPVCRRPMFGPERPVTPAGGRTGRPSGSSDHHDQSDNTDSARNANGDVDIDLPSGRGQGRAAERETWDIFYPEYMFRLRRMNHFYPTYVTTDMVDRWGNEGYRGTLATDTAFTRLEPRVVQEARTSGASGASFSFGGGSSSGGGGAGSSW